MLWLFISLTRQHHNIEFLELRIMDVMRLIGRNQYEHAFGLIRH